MPIHYQVNLERGDGRKILRRFFRALITRTLGTLLSLSFMLSVRFRVGRFEALHYDSRGIECLGAIFQIRRAQFCKVILPFFVTPANTVFLFIVV